MAYFGIDFGYDDPLVVSFPDCDCELDMVVTVLPVSRKERRLELRWFDFTSNVRRRKRWAELLRRSRQSPSPAKESR